MKQSNAGIKLKKIMYTSYNSEFNWAVHQSLQESYKPKPVPGVSDKRIAELVQEALQYIDNHSYSKAYCSRLLEGIDYLYRIENFSQLPLRVYFLAMNFLFFKKYPWKDYFEHLPFYLTLSLIISLCAAFCTKQIYEGSLISRIKVTQNIPNEPEAECRNRILKTAGRIIFELGVLIIDYPARILFSALLLFCGFVSLTSLNYCESSSALFSLGIFGMCYSLREIGQNLQESYLHTRLCIIDPNKLPKPLETDFKIQARCSITLDLIRLPGLLTGCGHVFELYSIIDWLSKASTCPICRSKVFITQEKSQNHLEFVSPVALVESGFQPHDSRQS